MWKDVKRDADGVEDEFVCGIENVRLLFLYNSTNWYRHGKKRAGNREKCKKRFDHMAKIRKQFMNMYFRKRGEALMTYGILKWNFSKLA